MSFPLRLLCRPPGLLVAASLLCSGGDVSEAAPAPIATKPLTAPAATTAKSSSRPSRTNTRKSPTISPGQQPAPSKTIEKKSGDRAPGNQDAWPPPPISRQFAPETPIDSSTPPPSLPRASRARMRACAEEWTRKKLLARSDLPRWRDFATSCLTQKTRP